MPGFFRCERIPDTFYLREAREHATIRDFPLATTTVGWVPDRTPAGPKRSGGLAAKAESCAGGLPTEDAAKGKQHRVSYPDNEFCS